MFNNISNLRNSVFIFSFYHSKVSELRKISYDFELRKISYDLTLFFDVIIRYSIAT